MWRFSKFFHSEILINVDAVVLLALFFKTFDLFWSDIVSPGRLYKDHFKYFLILNKKPSCDKVICLTIKIVIILNIEYKEKLCYYQN